MKSYVSAVSFPEGFELSNYYFDRSVVVITSLS